MTAKNSSLEVRAREWLERHGRFYCPVGNESTRKCPGCRKHDADLLALLTAVASEAVGELSCAIEACSDARLPCGECKGCREYRTGSPS